MKKQLILLSSAFLLLSCAQEGGSSSELSSSASSLDSESSLSSSVSEQDSSSSSEASNSSENSSAAASSDSNSGSSEESSSSSPSEEPPVLNYYSIAMDFAPGVNTSGLKQRYQEGATVSFSIVYDETVLTNVKVILNDVELTPVSEKAYSFEMPSKDSFLKITAEEKVKKYGFAEDIANATITYLDGIEYSSKVVAGTTISFVVTPDSGYAVTSVTVSYLNEEGETVQVEVNYSNSTYSFVMPASDVTIKVETGKLYSVIVPGFDENNAFKINIEGGYSHAEGEKVTFTVTQVDPSYSFVSLLAYTDYNLSEKTGTGSVSTSKETTETGWKYSFLMPAKPVYLVMNATKRYKITTEIDSNVEAITIDNQKDYYNLTDEVTFSVAFKEGYKADKVTANGTVLTPTDSKYSFKFSSFTSDVKIKVTSKSESEKSYWDEKTIYYFESGWEGNYKYLGEIDIGPETANILIYSQYDDGYDDYDYYGLRRNALMTATTPYWQSKSSSWSLYSSGARYNLPYSFDSSTNTMKITREETVFTLKFTIENDVATSFVIDKQIGILNMSFKSSAGATFVRYTGQSY